MNSNDRDFINKNLYIIREQLNTDVPNEYIDAVGLFLDELALKTGYYIYSHLRRIEEHKKG